MNTASTAILARTLRLDKADARSDLSRRCERRPIVPLPLAVPASAPRLLPLLRDLLILIAVAIPVVVLTTRFRIPTVVGFLLTGVAIGPNGLGLIGHAESVAGLAEIGVVLLLFAVGLELSLSRIVKMGRVVVRGGGLQVGLTILVVTLVALAAAVPLRLAIFFGALFALSSTAIILKVLADRSELDSSHGRIAVAVLLFQDLCVVPLMLVVPLLAGTGAGPGEAARTVLVSVAVVAALVLGGRIAVPWALQRIVELRNHEIFTLCVVFIGLGAAYITSLVGLSLALGAFLAGLIIAESEYGLQALSDVLPFRDTFSGIFFTSVGMLLDLGYVARHPVAVVGVAAGVVVLKTLVMMLVARTLRRSTRVGVASGLALAQGIRGSSFRGCSIPSSRSSPAGSRCRAAPSPPPPTSTACASPRARC